MNRRKKQHDKQKPADRKLAPQPTVALPIDHPVSPAKPETNREVKGGPQQPMIRADKISIAGLVIASIVAIIYFCQLREMQKQTTTITRQMLVSERAWVTPTIDIDEHPAIGQPFGATVHYENTGVTPAKTVYTQIAVHKVPANESPVFTYEAGVTNQLIGLLFPKVKLDLDAGFNGAIEKVPLSEEDFRQLTDGSAYVVAYLKITYTDVFGTSRFVTMCGWRGYKAAANYSSRDCVNYDAGDNN
jgi:hypothetical protein